MPTTSVSRRWIFVALSAGLVNALFARWLQIGPWQPDILLVSLVYLGLTSGPTAAVLVGFLTGIYQDLYAPQILGTHALAHTVTGYLAGVVGEKVQAEQVVIQVTTLCALCLLNSAMVGLTMGVSGLVGFLIHRALLSAVYTTVVGLLLVAVMSHWLLPRGWGVRDASARRRVR
ncbi:rod shape-determining protein MreD [Candidatus Fermentibacteria bacterium]|nr:rod shape-determining protein MreD [Candidatus Fermentibacteria bacterium]